MDGTDEAIMEVKSQVHVSSPLEKDLTNALKVLDEEEKKKLKNF